ncbi:hypothetical protein HWV62_38064 [Athelia sp. TMB]|nr:hypothetical protein HWV62_38064 [Athelia sp. TMB]
MSARPTQTPRPTEKAAAAQKKSNTVARSPTVKVEKSVSPVKRKATLSSGSEIEIVDEPSSRAATSPTKTRVRPSSRSETAVTPTTSSSIKQRDREAEESFFTNRSPPSTPSPSKPRGRVNSSLHKKEQRNAQKVLPAMQINSDEDPEHGPSEAEDITDPEFFNDHARNSPAGEGMHYDSEDYWRAVEPLPESDFIDDAAEVDEVPSPKKRAGASKKQAAPKFVLSSDDEEGTAPVTKERSGAVVKKILVTDDDLSDYSRKKLTASKAKGKRKATVVVSPVVTSDDEDGVMTKAEIAQMAEAKRLSLAESTRHKSTVERTGSPSIRPRSDASGGAAEPVPTSGVARQSKLLKAMDGTSSAGKATVVDSSTVYLEDIEVGVRGYTCPSECQVTNPADFDRKIDYTGLCNLLNALFISWSDTPHIGLATFSEWPTQIKNIIMKQVKKHIEFREFKHIRNPSRITPSTLSSKAIPGGNFVLIAAGSRDTVIQFTTLIFTTEKSQLYSLRDVLNENRRAIVGVPHIVEWERMQAALCMAFRISSAAVSMKAGSLLFCTAKTMTTAFSSSSSSSAKTSSFLKKAAVPASDSRASPFKAAKHAVTGTADVPVLDGRGTEFDLENTLIELDQVLPPFKGEIPEGSCVWVGYTCQKYDNKSWKMMGLNLNLMWAVVLGTP